MLSRQGVGPVLAVLAVIALGFVLGFRDFVTLPSAAPPALDRSSACPVCAECSPLRSGEAVRGSPQRAPPPAAAAAPAPAPFVN